MKQFAVRGNICYSEGPDQVRVTERGYAVCLDGISQGVFDVLPDEWKHLPCLDYGDSLVLPGLVDLHVHAPQYPFRGIGMDQELIDWLNTHTFPEEERYKDPEYAAFAYAAFAEDLLESASTRACIFATCHKDATLRLMEELEKRGLRAYVGKVNMDRNSPPGLCEPGAQASLEETESWIQTASRFSGIRPILTPRFIPTCSEELLDGLAVLQEQYNLPLQSHLSENLGEIAWVSELCPEASCYGDAYRRHGLFGGSCPTVMAHCQVLSQDKKSFGQEAVQFLILITENKCVVGIGRHTADSEQDQGFQAADIFVGRPEQGKIVIVVFAAGCTAAAAHGRERFFFPVNAVNQFLYCFFIKIYIRNGREQGLDDEPPGRGTYRPVSGNRPGKADQSACQLVLQICHVRWFSADTGFAGAAAASGCLFTLKAKHLMFHREFLRVFPDSL